MASTQMLKTTVQLPLGDERGEVTVQIPMTTFSSNANGESHDQLIADFNAVITTAVLEAIRNFTVDAEQIAPNDKIDFSLRYLGKDRCFRYNKDRALLVALQNLANRLELPVECLRMTYGPNRVYSDQTLEMVSEPTFRARLV